MAVIIIAIVIVASIKVTKMTMAVVMIIFSRVCSTLVVTRNTGRCARSCWSSSLSRPNAPYPYLSFI